MPTLSAYHKVNALFPIGCHSFLSCRLTSHHHKILCFCIFSGQVLVELYAPDYVLCKMLPFVHASLINHAMPRHTTPYHTTPRHAMPRHATPHHTTPRHATPRHCFLTGTSLCPYFFLHIFLCLLYLHSRRSGYMYTLYCDEDSLRKKGQQVTAFKGCSS